MLVENALPDVLRRVAELLGDWASMQVSKKNWLGVHARKLRE